MKADPLKPYSNLPLLPPKVDFKDQDILLATINASDAIAQLKTMLTMSDHTINNTLDLLSPLFVPEAVSSSGIENIITTNNSVYVAQILEERELNPAEKEALNYTNALTEGAIKLVSTGCLATNDYIAIQHILEPQKPGIRKLPGTQLKNPNTDVVYYTPPEGEVVIRKLLANFEQYFSEDVPAHEAFARMAILHYQFEAIHPFSDGNGRTGRMLMPLYLMKQGRLPVPVLFISRYILEHRDEYYKKLRSVTFTGAWKEWILYILAATAEQARYTCEVLEKIQRTIKNTRDILRTKSSSIYSAELVEFLFSNVYFTQKTFENELKVSMMTARRYLQELERQKIVVKKKQTGKNRYIYITPHYIRILKPV
ncbi:MAG TPA: Fic family protein [Candidatus Saccharimonadales bacterium]|jgi:Fic family protein